MQLLPPQPPHLDPELALKIAQASQEMLRKDFYSATFVIMGAAIIALCLWVVWLQVRLSGVQDRRVQDHVDGEARANAHMDRMAIHMDRSTETMEQVAAVVGIRPARRRGSKEAPVLGPEPTSTIKTGT